MKIGIIHGRFQGLHIGHIEYLLSGLERCDKLIIGICNPDPSQTAYSKENPHRSQDKSNPFTYFERTEMIRDSLLELGIERSRFEIVPFPINYPQKIKYYVPKNATYFITIYDDWGYAKKKELESLGYDVEVMWNKPINEKPTSGTEVRDKIFHDKEWKHLVPEAVYNYIIINKLDKRIKDLYKEN